MKENHELLIAFSVYRDYHPILLEQEILFQAFPFLWGPKSVTPLK